MLTGDLAQSWQRSSRTGPRLIDVDAAVNQQTASDLIAIVREHDGAKRAALDEALQFYVGADTDYKTVRGLVKLLIDACEFKVESPHEPTELRRLVFRQARAAHPVTASSSGSARAQVITKVAEQLGIEPNQVTDNLYADLFDQQRLTVFDEPQPIELLERYNLAQAQALLYRCLEMQLWIKAEHAADARQLFDAIKAYRLIHRITGTAASGYEVNLSGPVSMFHRSQKYGIQMAVFLPALLVCRNWRMRAEVKAKSVGAGNLFYELESTQTDLQSHYLSGETNDKSLLDRLLNGWTKLNSEWTLERCAEVIDLGASAFVPDLVARDRENRKVYIEAFGFWTPKHLERRLAELTEGKFTPFVLLASDELRCSREPVAKASANVIISKTNPDLHSVQAVIDEVAGK